MKLNKTMKKLVAFVCAIALVVAGTTGYKASSAKAAEWTATNGGWVVRTADGEYAAGEGVSFAEEGISAIYGGNWGASPVDIEVQGGEDPYNVPVNVKAFAPGDEWLVQACLNVKGLDAEKVYTIELKLGEEVLYSASVSSATEYQKTVALGNLAKLTVGESVLSLTAEEMVDDGEEVVVQDITITPNTNQIEANKTIYASWNVPDGTTKAYAYLGEAADGKGVVAANGWNFNNQAGQPMKAVDSVSRTVDSSIKVEPGETYKFIVEAYNAFNKKIGYGEVDITIPGKTAEELEADEYAAKINTVDNLALKKTAFVGSREENAKNIVDGNKNSTWQADKNIDNTYFGVDLGAPQKINKVLVIWEASNATAYDVMVSTDGEEYTTVATVAGLKNNQGQTVLSSFDAVTVQYVKIVCTGLSGNANTYGICPYEMAVFGTGEEVTTATPVVTTATPVVTTTEAPVLTTTEAPVITTIPATTAELSGNASGDLSGNAESTQPTITVAPIDGLQYSPAADGSLPYFFAWAPHATAESFNVYVNDTLVASTVINNYNAAEYFETAAAGEYTVSVTAVISGVESEKVSVTYTKEGADVTTADSTTAVDPTTTAVDPTTVGDETTAEPTTTVAEPTTTVVEPTTTVVEPTTETPVITGPMASATYEVYVGSEWAYAYGTGTVENGDMVFDMTRIGGGWDGAIWGMQGKVLGVSVNAGNEYTYSATVTSTADMKVRVKTSGAGDEAITFETIELKANEPYEYSVKLTATEDVLNIVWALSADAGENSDTAAKITIAGSDVVDETPVVTTAEETTVDTTTVDTTTAVDVTTTATEVTTTVKPTSADKVTKPGKVSVNKITKKKSAKKMKISIKPVAKANGYKVSVFTTKKNAKKLKKAIVTKTTKKNVKSVTVKGKKLKKAKKLFVRVAAYVNIKGKKVFGPWSKVKKVKIK